jgi:hypothetical protein
MSDETMSREDIINWVETHLNPSEGYMNNGLIPFNVQQFNEFNLAYHSDYMGTAGLWGFKNEKGEVVCSPKYLFEPICCGENYIVCIGTGWEHYDELPEDRIWSKEMRWGLINGKFDTIIPFEYDEIECVSPDLFDENGNELEHEIDYFVCRKYNDGKTKFYVESEVRDSKNNLIVSGYSDVDYRLEYDQLVAYKDRVSWGELDKPGYAGVYDFILDKEIIAPNKYHAIDIIDYNLFSISDYVESMTYQTLINEKEEIIGKEKYWYQVYRIYNDNSNYKYHGSTMDDKYYVFNIKDNKIVDQMEISRDEFLNKY